MSSQKNRFDQPLTYIDPKDEIKFAEKNRRFLARLNAQEPFMLFSGFVEAYGDHNGHSPFYDMIVLANGDRMPLPLVLQAFGSTIDLICDESTGAEIAEHLVKLFGDQFIGLFSYRTGWPKEYRLVFVRDADGVEKWMTVKDIRDSVFALDFVNYSGWDWHYDPIEGSVTAGDFRPVRLNRWLELLT